jgi:hypothetical protein
MKRSLCLVPLVATAIMLSAPGTSYAAATGDLWESTTQMTMEGMPAGMGIPAQTRRICAAKEWTKPPVQNEQNCEFSDFRTTGAKASWKMKCEGMSGEGEITRTSPEAYTGWMKMSMPQGAMTMNLSGRRVGDCDAGEAKTQRDAQMARMEAQMAAGQDAAKDAMKATCSVGAESLDLRTWRSYEELCTGPQGGLTAAAYKASFCDKAKSSDGFKKLAERRKDPHGGFDEVVSFCGLDPVALTKTLCEQAVKTNDLMVIGKDCPKEAQAIAKKECGGRSYTSMGASPYAAFCLTYAADVMKGGANAP